MTRSDSFVRASNVAVNVAVPGFLGFFAVGPDGYVWKTLAERAAENRLQERITQLWEAVAAGAESDKPVIIEFIDYQCPFCRSMQATLDRAEKDELIAVIRLHYPIRPIHPRAEAAARVAICAEAVGRLPEMHRYLVSTDAWYNEAVGWERAISASSISDQSRFLECLPSMPVTERLFRDSAFAARLGVTSTPTYVSANALRRGVMSLEELVAFAQR